MSAADDMLLFLWGRDQSRPRSRQIEVGPSSAGDCARRVWHEFRGTPRSNPDCDLLPAIMGTAIHEEIARAFKAADPWEERYEVEVEVKSGWIKGHVDLFVKHSGEVVDWKTTTKKNLKYLGSDQQQQQIQLYGWLLTANGYDVKTVSLVGIARDGGESDVRTVSYPYDPEKAQKALEGLERIRDQDDPPAPEKPPALFCSAYCVFYDPQAAPDSPDSCPGKVGGR